MLVLMNLLELLFDLKPCLVINPMLDGFWIVLGGLVEAFPPSILPIVWFNLASIPNLGALAS